MTRKQFNIFLDVISKLKSANINPGMLHICNSSAFFKYKEMYMNAVRIGSALTGRLQISNTTGLQRVGYLESEICDIKYVKKGQNIIEEVKQELELFQEKGEDAQRFNPPLRHSTKKHPMSEKFIKELAEKPFEKVYKKYIYWGNKWMLFYRLIRKIKEKLIRE